MIRFVSRLWILKFSSFSFPKHFPIYLLSAAGCFWHPGSIRRLGYAGKVPLWTQLRRQWQRPILFYASENHFTVPPSWSCFRLLRFITSFGNSVISIAQGCLFVKRSGRCLLRLHTGNPVLFLPYLQQQLRWRQQIHVNPIERNLHFCLYLVHIGMLYLPRKYESEELVTTVGGLFLYAWKKCKKPVKNNAKWYRHLCKCLVQYTQTIT